jgi:glycosyltransferase involved in cell wall biosynthesis
VNSRQPCSGDTFSFFLSIIRSVEVLQISVIIPTYNRAKYVIKAVNSVLSQTCRNPEIIVVDDGSSDETRKALAPYSDKIRYIYQDNSGVSSARNRGILEAQGDWIAFLDSDDEWLSGYLYAQMRSIRRYPRAVAHITNSVAFSKDNEPQTDHFLEIGLLRKFRNDRQIYLRNPFRTIVSHPHWFLQSTVMRRDVLLATNLFNPDLSMAEDIDVIAQMAMKGPFTISSEVLVSVHRREEEIVNLSAQFMNRGIYSFKCFCKVFSDLAERPELGRLDRLALYRTLGERWRVLGNLYLKSGNREKAREQYLSSIRFCPTPKSLVKYLGAFLPNKAALLLTRKSDIAPGDEESLL